MIAEKLKKSILQAAIQGKLTQREPGDGTAAELLQQIAAEKAKLIKEGKIKKRSVLVAEQRYPDLRRINCCCSSLALFAHLLQLEIGIHR